MILGYPIQLRQAGQNLAEWLEIAIWGLVPMAQERIRAEIEAHYAEAVQAHLGKGSSELAARTAALAELGNPRAAARRFRREHLTVGEARLLTRWFNPVKGAGGSIFLMGLWWTFLFLPSPEILYSTYPQNWSGMGDPHFVFRVALGFLQILITGGAILAAGVIARRKGSLVNARKIVLLACILWLNICILLLGHYSFVPLFVAIFLGGPLSVFIQVLRLHKKLREARVDDLSSYGPTVV